MSAPSPPEGLGAVVTALGARQRLRELLVGAQTWDLIAGAATAGWFTTLSSATTAEALASDHDLPVEQVHDVLVVLTAAGVVEGRDDGTFSLAPDLAATLPAPSGVGLDVVLADLDLQRARTAAATSATVTAGAEDALTVARAWGLEATPAARELYAMVYAAVPEVQQALAPGAAYLDVGSGVGGNLLTTALLFPGVVATGIEIDDAVGAELIRRVGAAGLTDRVTVLVDDAAELADTARFDVAFWAQEFFADAARPSALAATVRALKPGGWLLLQELASGGPDTAPAAALDRLYRRGWNAARSRSAEELVTEATGAGLESFGIRESAAGRLVLLRRPLAS